MKKKIVRLTEDDLVRIVERVVKEQIVDDGDRGLPKEAQELMDCITSIIGNEELPEECMSCVTNPTVESCESCYNALKGKLNFIKLGQLMMCFGKLCVKF